MAKNAKMKYAIETAYTIDNKKHAGAYRNGKPEGIVLHENGNPNYPTITQEISFMTRNFMSAFTHAWADNAVIKEIANTDYRCWGAGAYANARFAQIETLRMRDRAQAVQAIDRALFWGAYQLYYYGLPCTDATINGNGTVWTHRAVSQFLGNTNHTDPIGYWESVGVTWAMAYKQLKAYYDALHAGDSTTVPTLGQGAVAQPAPAPVAPAPQPAPKPAPKPASKWVTEYGTFRPDRTINVRSGPSTGYGVVATYSAGQSVRYDSYMFDGRYTWIHYVSYTGAHRYMVCRENGTPWGTFS